MSNLINENSPFTVGALLTALLDAAHKNPEAMEWPVKVYFDGRTINVPNIIAFHLFACGMSADSAVMLMDYGAAEIAASANTENEAKRIIDSARKAGL